MGNSSLDVSAPFDGRIDLLQSKDAEKKPISRTTDAFLAGHFD